MRLRFLNLKLCNAAFELLMHSFGYLAFVSSRSFIGTFLSSASLLSSIHNNKSIRYEFPVYLSEREQKHFLVLFAGAILFSLMLIRNKFAYHFVFILSSFRFRFIYCEEWW